MLGRTLGQYELLGELGRGGMAELYLAKSRGPEGFEKLVAIKRILPHLAHDAEFVAMFAHEARVAAKLSHPNICPVHELESVDGELILVMEYLEGVSWGELVAATPPGPDSLRLVAGVLPQACEGLHHAHAHHDVVHRDVSPQNLFVTVHGACKVLDFGVAKLTKEGPRTRTGLLKGKLPYMSPEQIKGDPLDARSDVFALGVVLWEALAHERLFDRDTDYLIWNAIMEDAIPLLAPRGYPAEVDAVIQAALARDRERRFRSAHALGEAIRGLAPAMSATEIATLVRARTGDRPRVDERATSIETPAAQAKLRSEPVVIQRARDTAAATSDLRAHASPPRRRWPIVAGAAGVISLVAAAIVVTAIVVGKHGDPSPAPPPPAPSDKPRTGLSLSTDGISISKGDKHIGFKTGEITVDSVWGTFTVDSTPAATIYEDGLSIGETPLWRTGMHRGTHHLKAVRADGREQKLDVDIRADEDTDLGSLAW